MADPSLETSRRRVALIATVVVVAVVVLGLIGLVLSARTPAPPAPPAPGQPAIAPSDGVPASLLPAPLGRADILIAATSAAAAHATGAPPPAPEATLIGRPFLVKVPFGCLGPDTARLDGVGGFDFDAPSRTVRLRVRPQVWTATAFAEAAAKAGQSPVEAAEGFWLPRPWMMGQACPAATQHAAAPSAEAANAPGRAALPPPEARTVGLVVFYRSADSRLERRGDRPYEAVKKLPTDAQVPSPQGYRLVLSGRVNGYGPSGPAFHCEGSDPDSRPVCLLAVELDYVAFEDPGTGSILAEWRS